MYTTVVKLIGPNGAYQGRSGPLIHLSKPCDLRGGVDGGTGQHLRSPGVPLNKPWLALLGLRWDCGTMYSISSVILWDISNSNSKSSTQQHLWYASY